MIVATGEKLHIVTRRFFDGDLRRHFVGVVEQSTDTVVRVKGYDFVFDQAVNEFTRRSKSRTRVFGLTGDGLIITLLPETVNLEEIRYAVDPTGKRTLTDNLGFELNISEFGASR